MLDNQLKNEQLNRDYQHRKLILAQQHQLAGSLQTEKLLPSARHLMRAMMTAALIFILLMEAGLANAQEKTLLDPGTGGGAGTDHFMDAMGYMRTGDYDKAVASLDAFLEIAPDHTAAYTARAENHLYLENYDSAVDDAAAAIKISPQYARAYWVLGEAYFAQGDFILAEENLQRFIDLKKGVVSQSVIEKLEICAKANANS